MTRESVNGYKNKTGGECVMKVERLDRVYIYVRDLKKAMDFFSNLLGTHFCEPMERDEVGMIMTYSPTGLTLAAPTRPDSIVAKTI